MTYSQDFDEHTLFWHVKDANRHWPQHRRHHVESLPAYPHREGRLDRDRSRLEAACKWLGLGLEDTQPDPMAFRPDIVRKPRWLRELVARAHLPYAIVVWADKRVTVLGREYFPLGLVRTDDYDWADYRQHSIAVPHVDPVALRSVLIGPDTLHRFEKLPSGQCCARDAGDEYTGWIYNDISSPWESRSANKRYWTRMNKVLAALGEVVP